MIVERLPEVHEYQALRQTLKLDEVPDEAVARGLKNSLYAVCVVHEGELVGLGRVIGDGGLYFYIQDLMVAPEFRDMGIQQCVMDKIMDFLKETAPENAFFCTKADGTVADFCKQYGFTRK